MLTGLFFGSFNPVHIGHLAVANYMSEFTDLEEIWFVVSPQNPLKEKEVLWDENLRLEMMKAAIGDDSRYKVTDVEYTLPKPSYTIDTMQYLQTIYPDREFVIIMGSDCLESFKLWKDYEQIISGYKRYIYPRSGYMVNSSDNIENGIMVNAPLLNISSTFIRESVANGKNMKYFVPYPVWEIIVKQNIYKKF